MPALEYLKTLPSKDQRRFVGLFSQIAVEGPQGLTAAMLRTFIGDDAKDNMAEFRVGSHMGFRVLCFKRHLRLPSDEDGPVPSVILAHGFTKPNQPDTPAKDKTQARSVLAEYLSTLD